MLTGLENLFLELLIVNLEPVDVRAPARTRLGEVHHVLDLLRGRPVELGRFGVSFTCAVVRGISLLTTTRNTCQGRVPMK